MSETGMAVQREEKPTAIHPVKFENLADHVNKMFETVARRAYEIFEVNGRIFGHEIEDWFKAEQEFLHPVHVAITDSAAEVEVKAEVPGFNDKEIEVSVEPRRLTITGKRESNKREEEKKGKNVCEEFCSDQIVRIVDLPAAVDADSVTATLKNGVLQMTMPKAAQGKTIETKPRAA